MEKRIRTLTRSPGALGRAGRARRHLGFTVVIELADYGIGLRILNDRPDKPTSLWELVDVAYDPNRNLLGLKSVLSHAKVPSVVLVDQLPPDRLVRCEEGLDRHVGADDVGLVRNGPDLQILTELVA